MNRKTLFLIFVLPALIGCSEKKSIRNGEEASIGQLKTWMTGTFNSSDQASSDESFFDITLHMYPIWEEEADEDEFYLYVEQAVTFTLDSPYRQRIYHIQKTGPTKFVSNIYLLPSEDSYVGAFLLPEKFDSLEPENLDLKEGCTVYLRYEDGQYKGETEEGSCESNLQGAAFATSEVVIDKKKIYSWDRGFNEAGEQVWGAEKGGYIFKKISGKPTG